VAAWNAATYVAQIDEARLAEATSTGVYLDATRRVMQTHGGIWWNNERYVIARNG
jgi:alkylation response protein AidB-like acyl-CoA dehydrogenase